MEPVRIDIDAKGGSYGSIWNYRHVIGNFGIYIWNEFNGKNRKVDKKVKEKG